MQLVVDAGNTKIKLAVFKEDQLLQRLEVVEAHFIEALAKFIGNYAIDMAIIASVGNLSEIQMRAVQNRFPTIVLDHQTPVPFINAYKSPKTLGVDRLALVAAFAKAYPDQNGLIIDAGTCVTYDFIDAQKTYHGGAISPGLRLRYTSLHSHTANLPLLSVQEEIELIGDTTIAAIHSGVYNGLVQEIDGVIMQYRQKYEPLTVVLTGGDAKVLSKRLKNSIFAHSNFLLEGLNYILKLTND